MPAGHPARASHQQRSNQRSARFCDDQEAVSDQNADSDAPAAPDEAAAGPNSAVPEVGPAVMARAVRGDDHAFATVINHYDHILRSFACHLVGDSDRMDEVLTESYVKAYRLLPAYRADTRPSTWLLRIVYGAGARAVGVEGADNNPGGESPAGPVPGQPEHHSDNDRTGQLALWLDEALAQLSPERRAAVLLVDGVGADPVSAAEVLGISVDELADWLAGARPDLRAVIAAGGEGRRP
jgi:RNA polymerase sigma-70 factor (ECF subfamily)